MSEPKRTVDSPLYSPTSYEPKVLTSIVANAFNYAVGRGLDFEQLSVATGLQQTDLIDPETRLPEAAVLTIWRLLSEAYPGEALALHAASAAPFSALGQVALAIQYAPNTRSAIDALVQYRSVLFDRLSIEVSESSSELMLKMHHPVDNTMPGYGAEAGLAVLNRLGKATIGGKSPLIQVNFKHQPFGDPQRYETFFGVPVHFQQPTNGFVILKEVLDRPNPNGDVYLFRYIQRNLDLLQARWQLPLQSLEIRELYDTVARNADISEYSAEALAKRMNMSRRTLHRLAQAHGLSLRDILDNARRQHAKQLLQDPTLQMKDISQRLGYADERSFRRAFKRWSGQSPTAFRKGLFQNGVLRRG